MEGSGAGLASRGCQGYSGDAVYVLRAMKNGHSLRLSVPRDVQRHLGLRRGDIVVMELREGGRVEFYKVDPQKVRAARVFDDPV